jgi:hypothetical protein
VAELALDHVQRHALAGHLYRVGVAKLMRCDASPHPGLGRQPSHVYSHAGASPWSSGGGPVNDAEQRADRQRHPLLEPRSPVLLAPVVRADLPPLSALAVADE